MMGLLKGNTILSQGRSVLGEEGEGWCSKVRDNERSKLISVCSSKSSTSRVLEVDI